MALFFLSPTKLGTWRKCKRAFRFKYVDRMKGIPRPWLSFGRSLHAALKAAYDARPENRTLALARRALGSEWDRTGYANPDEEARYRERAETALVLYTEREADFATAPRPKVLEFEVASKIGDVVLFGKVDRIDEDQDGLVVIDYKTGQVAPPERAQGDIALTMYAMLVTDRFKTAPSRLEWRFVEHGERVVTHREPSAFARVKADVLAAAADIQAETAFEPSPSPGCRFCDYLDRCEEGSAWVRLNDPGAGEPE